MFHNIDTTAWLSNLSRRKLQTATSPSERPREGDTLLRRVLLRNSITRVDLALAGAQEAHLQLPPQPSSIPSSTGSSSLATALPLVPSSLSPPSPPPAGPGPAPASDLVDNEFVFPSLPNGRVYTPEETIAEERWLDSLLDTLSDGDDDDDDEYAHALVVHVESSPEPEDEDDYLDLEGLAWLMSAAADEQPTISVPSPTSMPVRSLSPPRALPMGPLELPFYYPLPDDSDDDLSTPGMEEDVEGESEADSLEWPSTPGSQFRSTASLGRSSSTSSLNNLVASGSEHTHAPSSPSAPRERVILKSAKHPATDKLRIHSVHFPDKQLYMSPPERQQK
jgi:hypothetical protein